MFFEYSYDLLDYYRCVDDCLRKAVPDPNSEELTIKWLDSIRKFRLMQIENFSRG